MFVCVTMVLLAGVLGPACAFEERDGLIIYYFSLGYSYRLIVCFLFFVHGILLSLRQLKRILSYLGLRRRHQALDSVLYNRTLTLIRVSTREYHWMVGIIWSVEPLACVHQMNVSGRFYVMQNELQGSGSMLGYRALWRRLRINHQLPVPR